MALEWPSWLVVLDISRQYLVVYTRTTSVTLTLVCSKELLCNVSLASMESRSIPDIWSNGFPYDLSSARLTLVWPLYDLYLISVGPPSDLCVTSILSLSDLYLTAVWPLSYPYLTPIWPLSPPPRQSVLTLDGPLVKEFRHTFDLDWVSQVTRLYSDQPYAEVEWQVGPIPIE